MYKPTTEADGFRMKFEEERERVNKLRDALLDIEAAYISRSELFRSDIACAVSLADRARSALDKDDRR